MAVSCQWMSDLFTRVQAEFLETPALSLTADAAAMRFDTDPVTCAAVLDTLAAAGVLTRRRNGVYCRFVPRRGRTGHASGARPAAAHALPPAREAVIEEARS